MFWSKRQTDALVGICPEDSGIAVARVRRTSDAEPMLELCEYHPAASGEASDLALTKLTKTHRLDRYPCTSPIDLGAYNLLLVEAPDVPPAELRAAMRWHVKDLIDFHIDDAVIDVFEISDDEASGRARPMYAVAARAATVKQRVDMLIGAGLKLSTIDIPELALRNIAKRLPEDTAGVALLYLAEEGGLITITRQGRLYLSRLLDAPRFTQFSADALSAEDAGVQNWLDGIIVELQRSMDYYESHFSKPPVANVVVAPTRTPIGGLDGYMSSQLGVPVRELDLNSVLEGPQPLDRDVQFQCLLAVGAALREEGRTL